MILSEIFKNRLRELAGIGEEENQVIKELKKRELYHGHEMGQPLSRNTFLTDKKHVAKAYGERGGRRNTEVITCVRLTDNILHDSAKYMDEVEEIVNELSGGEFDGVVFEDYDDGFDVFDNYVIFDPKNLFVGDAKELASYYADAKRRGSDPELVKKVEKIIIEKNEIV